MEISKPETQLSYDPDILLLCIQKNQIHVQ
jgi:hypothetical protein